MNIVERLLDAGFRVNLQKEARDSWWCSISFANQTAEGCGGDMNTALFDAMIGMLRSVTATELEDS